MTESRARTRRWQDRDIPVVNIPLGHWWLLPLVVTLQGAAALLAGIHGLAERFFNGRIR